MLDMTLRINSLRKLITRIMLPIMLAQLLWAPVSATAAQRAISMPAFDASVYRTRFYYCRSRADEIDLMQNYSFLQEFDWLNATCHASISKTWKFHGKTYLDQVKVGTLRDSFAPFGTGRNRRVFCLATRAARVQWVAAWVSKLVSRRHKAVAMHTPRGELYYSHCVREPTTCTTPRRGHASTLRIVRYIVYLAARLCL